MSNNMGATTAENAFKRTFARAGTRFRGFLSMSDNIHYVKSQTASGHHGAGPGSTMQRTGRMLSICGDFDAGQGGNTFPGEKAAQIESGGSVRVVYGPPPTPLFGGPGVGRHGAPWP